jgi:Fe-S-cluster containining protein
VVVAIKAFEPISIIDEPSIAYVLDRRPLYFPWLSGTLQYSCSTCDAPCCKGTDLGIARSRELVTLQAAQPKLALFAQPQFQDSAMLSVTTGSDRCWFFSTTQRCRLEKHLGRDHKPTGCRLFPFSKLLTMGEAVVVLPDFVCPIQLGDAASSAGKEFSHDSLTREMHRTQVSARGHPALDAPWDTTWEEALHLEQRIVAESRVYLPSAEWREYVAAQHDLTTGFFGRVSRPQAMANVEGNARRFLSVNDELTATGRRSLIALSGVLRLLLAGHARSTMPQMLAAFAVLVAAAENVRGAKPSLRAWVNLWKSQSDLVYVLAHLHERPAVRPGLQGSLRMHVQQMRTTLVRDAVYPLLEQLEMNGRRSLSMTVEDLLRVCGDTFAAPLTADAVALLHVVGRVLREHCVFSPL